MTQALPWPTSSSKREVRMTATRLEKRRPVANFALRLVVAVSCLHCLFEFSTFFSSNRERHYSELPLQKTDTQSSISASPRHASSKLPHSPNNVGLPHFRNPPMHKLERLYSTTDDIFRLIDDDLDHTYRSRKKYGYSPYPPACHNKVLCGPREEERRKKESLSRALSSLTNFEHASSRLYIDLGGRSYDTSVGWFMRHYPMTFDHVHVFEADDKYARDYLGKANITFHNVIVSDVDGTAVTADDGCHWIKTPETKSSAATKRRRLLQVPTLQKPLRTINFARWLSESVSVDDMVIVKMDIEGEEYSLLPKMIEDGSIRLISELFLETHNLRFNRHPCIGADKTRADSFRLLKSLRDAGVYVHEWY